ncbi:hypothetical protein ACFYOY_43960 [Streptomyces sp. NPDC007875]|uniref:hypothetical protein n=1 Tax=Streptomyces sp. NPDC007875 TaxID=3364783 RepID=UPI0036AA8BCB
MGTLGRDEPTRRPARCNWACAACLRRVHGRVIRIGREALRCLLVRRGITFQANARHPGVLAAEREERARIRGEKSVRRGGRPFATAA